MKGINEIRDYLIKHRTDKDGNLDLSDLDFKDFNGDILLNGMEAKTVINNTSQRAELIFNFYQEAKEIDNTYQKADEIDNTNQRAELIWNIKQEAKYKKS